MGGRHGFVAILSIKDGGNCERHDELKHGPG